MARVLVLQHIACEPPGAFGEVLSARGLQLVPVELDEGEPPPRSPEGFAAVVAMGGPMGAYEEERHPWLAAEKALVRATVEHGVPFWGSCLGVQLLAASLGAEVRPGAAPEVGVLPVHATPAGEADPVFGGLRWPRPTLQWHADTFDLPAGATLLASSPAYPHQAFRVGRVAYGVQFHLEVTAEMARAWAEVPAYVESARRTLGEGGLERLLAAFEEARVGMLADARTLFGRWVDLWA